MRWLLILLVLVSCRSEQLAYPSRPAAVPVRPALVRISTVAECERTPAPPDGVIDAKVLEAYIQDLSARLEACADKLDKLNERIRRSRRK